MATYKMIQDVEAEDKILGPLTLRQFIFAMIAIFLFYICFIVISRGAAFLLILFLPPALFFGFFAMPFGRDQPTEVWALAKIRFWFKPRKRVWNQSGVKELVTITAPKKVEHIVTDGLSQTEVKSRLKALAETIDSRGWAVKNISVNTYAPPLAIVSSDRLVDLDSAPQEVPNYDVAAVQDVLDENTSPIAQQFNNMIAKSERTKRQQLMQNLNSPNPQPAPPAPNNNYSQSANQPPADYWFMGQASGPNAASVPSSVPAPVAADETPDERALGAKLKAQAADKPTPYTHLRTVQPLDSQSAPAASSPVQAPSQAASAPVKSASDPAILSLADNDDLNVATLQREAKRTQDQQGQKSLGEDDQEGEVVISLR